MKKIIALIFLSFLFCCGNETPPTSSSINDVGVTFWMESADFYRCGLASVNVKVDSKDIGSMHRKAESGVWKVEVFTIISEGQHRYYALGKRDYKASNTIYWEDTFIAKPFFGATIHLICGSHK